MKKFWHETEKHNINRASANGVKKIPEEMKKNFPSLRIMTLNLRYESANDGLNSWDTNHGTGQRKEIVIDLLETYQPNIFCTQEATLSQLLFLEKSLKGYDWIGLGREGGQKGEHTAIFYEKSYLTLQNNDTFWLSRTPEKAGSKSWGATWPRIVTWACFNLENLTGPLYVFNTHFSNDSQEARKKSAKLLRDYVNRITQEKDHVFIAGDFNTVPDKEAWKVLTGGKFNDAWLSAESRSGPGFTFHGFDGLDASEENQKRIDWIIYRSPILKTPKKVEITPFEKGNRHPSDHFPVVLFSAN